MLLRMQAHLIAALVAAAGTSAAVSVREFRRAPSIVQAAEERGPVAWVVVAHTPTAASPVGSERSATDAEYSAIALALGSLSASQLDELRAGLDLLASRVEARANPFGDDLEDGPPGEAMATVRRSLAPALTAAHHLTARTQTSADGTFAVTLGATCAEAPAGATCFPLWGASADASGASAERAELRERASFFAWPIASAAVVRTSAGARATDLLEVLRERARSPQSHVSLALDERAIAGEPDPRVVAIRDAARNVLARAKGSSPADLAALQALRPLAATPPPGRRVPSLTLAPGEIMIVPKLGGLSDLDGFARELDQLFAERDLARQVRWVRRPRLRAHQR